MTAVADEVLFAQAAEILRLEDEAEHARKDPAYLVSFMSAPDERTGETFHFTHLRDDETAAGHPWGWQREYFLWLYGELRTITLKARQLGVTWMGCAACVADALTLPGSLDLIYRQKEEEAIENVRRCWALYQSLPNHLRMDAEVLSPARGALPSTEIRLRFPGGKISRILAMTSASASGHGKTARRALLDEHSRIERAAEIMKAVQPAAGSKGHISIISTANGVSNEETGEGNQFHWLWVNADEAGFSTRFLPWSMHPDRDQAWYDHDPEVRGLKPHERAEQYPANEDEAFTLTKRLFFDADDLMWYAKHRVQDPLYRCDFVDPKDKHKLATGPQATLAKWDSSLLEARVAGRVSEATGAIRVYAEPRSDRKYAIGADVATGDGLDYCAAYVVDLVSLQLVAELRQRFGGDIYAAQLHYLGRRYNTARLAIEAQGGYGDTVLAALRDRTAGRPPYPNIYRHRLDAQAANPEQKRYGWPTNSATRPKILNQLERHIRERSLPYVTHRLLAEMRTFIEDDKRSPSPRAQSGSHDDCVMAASIALEMYRQLGDFPSRKRSGRSKSARPPVSYPWQQAA